MSDISDPLSNPSYFYPEIFFVNFAMPVQQNVMNKNMKNITSGPMLIAMVHLI